MGTQLSIHNGIIRRKSSLTSTSEIPYYKGMQQTLARVLVENPVIITPSPVNTAQAPASFLSRLRTSGISSTMSSIARYGALYSALFLIPIGSAYGLTYAAKLKGGISLRTPVAAVSVEESHAQVQAASATNTIVADSSPTAQPSQSFEYELSLANGFLKKAVEISNRSEVQTVDEKDMIVQLLNQGLDASNRAIEMNPNNPEGYTSRGRIYQATSVIKPEMKTLADQDFAKASSLGSPNPTQAPETKNPLELLPTEQAQGRATAMIAGPEDSRTKETVQSSTEQNATRGVITLPVGSVEIAVPYPQVKDTTQLYVTAEKNPENITLYVKNKQAGVGFTIAATSAPTAPVDITWWEIE